MVDLKAQARSQKATAKRQASTEARRQATIRMSQEVINEFNAAHEFDVTTELGVDQLNRKVWESTGRTIWQIRDERLKSQGAA